MAAKSAERAGASERRRYEEQLRILVVDDDRDTLDTLSFILKDEGYVVHSATSGQEALRAVRVFRPDVVIHDIAVPGMSGYAVAQSIRYGFTDLRRPFMIAISGVWKELPDRRVAEQMGFDEYLTKPCDTAELLRLLDSFKRSRVPPHLPSS
jgi:CheY-like chemotaxis protein